MFHELKRRWPLLVLLWLMASCQWCYAIDNPDVPDLVAQFEARSKIYEINVFDKAGDGQQVARASGEYEKFLDHELNLAYQALIIRLNGTARQSLGVSQRFWLNYRDAEFLFISKNWTLENFGSSYVISIGAYRADIIKRRVIALLHYLKNYANTPTTRSDN